MQVSEIELFRILKDKVGEEEAKTLTEYIETKVEKQFEIKKDVLATKQDLAELKGEIRLEMANHKAEIIKWMFIFWVGQLAAMIAIAELIIKR
ncbi:hypothetical protein [Mucilaginibacter arboris]|uniref:DUF1640 domain-containing protein n=1 Tax=Mucilaginibacter arboris TaxID=2682090 RepID=A0A7K1SV35_9SPHI|nr:hypothetical protein [Mucilaginibacter arboris]MVN21107.1 hypothetical protein [Mucilaginibacter arboris]